MRPIDVTPDLARLRVAMVNVYLYGRPGAGDRGWVLIDTGLPDRAGMIDRRRRGRFGADARPSAIVLTHGHSIMSGALRTLAEQWDVPVFAHPLELPYLTGRSAYPPADPPWAAGLIALLSPLYRPWPGRPRRPGAARCRRTAACRGWRDGAGCSHPGTRPATSRCSARPTGP